MTTGKRLGWPRFATPAEEQLYLESQQDTNLSRTRLTAVILFTLFCLAASLDWQVFAGSPKLSTLLALRALSVAGGLVTLWALRLRPSPARLQWTHLAYWAWLALLYTAVARLYLLETGHSSQRVFFPALAAMAVLLNPGHLKTGLFAGLLTLASGLGLNFSLDTGQLVPVFVGGVVALVTSLWFAVRVERNRRKEYSQGLELKQYSKELEATRAELQQQLVHAKKSEALGRLAAGVAHDFNNVLTVVEGNAELIRCDLQDQPTLSEASECLTQIVAASQHAAALTRQLLLFGTPSATHAETLPLDATLGKIGHFLRRLVPAHIRYEEDFQCDERCVHIDRTHLEQVLSNLVVNAVDAMAEGGQLTVATRASGEHLQLRISDEGSGMDANQLTQLFEPFFTTKPTGTGLGLATVKAVLEKANCSISVESKPTQGTCFEVNFPLAAGSTELSTASAPKSVRRSLVDKTATLLVCDDDPRVLALVERVVARANFQFLSAGTPDAALRLATHHSAPIDLLITDVIMPDMSGPELAERIQQLWGSTAVLYISGYTDALLRSHRLERQLLLRKPFNPSALLDAIADALGGHHAQKN